jgi:hypothetical protein
MYMLKEAYNKLAREADFTKIGADGNQHYY